MSTFFFGKRRTCSLSVPHGMTFINPLLTKKQLHVMKAPGLVPLLYSPSPRLLLISYSLTRHSNVVLRAPDSARITFHICSIEIHISCHRRLVDRTLPTLNLLVARSPIGLSCVCRIYVIHIHPPFCSGKFLERKCLWHWCIIMFRKRTQTRNPNAWNLEILFHDDKTVLFLL